MLLGYKQEGFYVDIGACDPHFLNNTKKFYDRGWTGINVEPNPERFAKLQASRTKDININAGVALKQGKMKYYNFKQAEVSTFSFERAEHLKNDGFNLIATEEVPIITLSEVFARAKQPVDFISIDVEGYDFEVLQSNDWDKYKPKLICLEDDGKTDYVQYLKKFGYKKLFNNNVNSFFALS